MITRTEYKIRDKVTGRWSPGGCRADREAWPKGSKGKTWNGIGPLKSHLRQFVEMDWKTRTEVNKIPESWEVVPVQVVYSSIEGEAIPAKSLIKEATNE